MLTYVYQLLRTCERMNKQEMQVLFFCVFLLCVSVFAIVFFCFKSSSKKVLDREGSKWYTSIAVRWGQTKIPECSVSSGQISLKKLKKTAWQAAWILIRYTSRRKTTRWPLKTEQCKHMKCQCARFYFIERQSNVTQTISKTELDSSSHIMESLILAQDERWRRA